MDKSSGYSLVELIAILVLIAIIAGISVTNLSGGDSLKLQATRDDIVAGLFYAQQTAVARSSATNGVTIEFVSTGSAIDVRENGTSLSGGSGIYPLALPSDMTLTSATITFDKLGRTNATMLTLSDGSGSAEINVSESGYAR